MINYNVCIILYHAAILDRSLIANCSVYLCNSCNVVSYKAVTVVFFLNIEKIEWQYTDSSKFNRPNATKTNP